MKINRSRIIFVLFTLAAAALLIFALRPSPPKVEIAQVDRGRLVVTVDEEGEARAHDRFVIAAPIAGRLTRVELHEGDAVGLGQVVAAINPLPLDQREREELLARIQSAEALRLEADAQVAHVQADYEQARRERERGDRLVRGGLVSTQSVEQARNLEATSLSELEAARFKATAAASNVREAKAGLVALEAEPKGPSRTVRLHSPVKGKVLRIVEKSERVVASGAPLLILGDPNKLEVVTDFLSTDAVKIRAGMPVILEGWGGDRQIRARVRIVEASAFTKVSALGIEEQRVNVVADLIDSPGPIGDGYRVEARIVIWEGEQVLKAPSSALFRHGAGWSLFGVEDGRLRRFDVETGHRSQFETEILQGLEAGEAVVLHPTNELTEGMRVEPRSLSPARL
jgi:HlyD family secretion protein